MEAHLLPRLEPGEAEAHRLPRSNEVLDLAQARRRRALNVEAAVCAGRSLPCRDAVAANRVARERLPRQRPGCELALRRQPRVDFAPIRPPHGYLDRAAWREAQHANVVGLVDLDLAVIRGKLDAGCVGLCRTAAVADLEV